MVSFGFDTGSTRPDANFDPLPPGWYAMRINKVEMKPSIESKPGTGDQLRMEFVVIDHMHPEHAGRRVWANLRHNHENKQTRDIARAQISSILHAIGKPGSSDTDDMLGGELRVKLAVRPAEDGYDARNDAKGYKGLSEVVEAPAAGQPAAPSSAPAPAAKAAPWKR